jgi:pimeloyl-ACP methyl ester carboxylesterase
MPYISIRGADFYYETFGKIGPDKAPVVLIHGSTGTGHSNWDLVAPLLARDYYVIVPDCRGHGKSSNPAKTYSFKEMADDTASLIQHLGFRRAHVVGHSNGGNVALVVLMEHPEVIQTAVLQAANAYVSQDLIEKEPPLFEPDRVLRESPEWVNEMIRLHGETHGLDYWRDLLSLTVNELIREPNCTPEDLSEVQRPTFVIQGENDGVNAPSRHAQFIARHIPDAELWVPAGIGHSVHQEILFTWIDKVLDFLERRGNDHGDRIYRLGHQLSPDDRNTVFQVKTATISQEGKQYLRLSGQVLEERQHQTVLDLFKGQVLDDEIHVLLTTSTPWALVNRSVSDLRREPHSLSERVSQALLAEAAQILEDRGEWAKVRLERDGYLGWMQSAGLHPCEKQQVESYQQSCTHLITAGIVSTYHQPEIKDGKELDEAGQLVFGLVVPVVERTIGMAAICKPDGEVCWVPDTALLPIAKRPQPDPEGVAHTLQLIRRFVGVPYLWGGRTPYGFDCSGLAQTFLEFLGIPVPRDADQQFKVGTPVESDFMPGDLLFFGESKDIDYLPGEPTAPRRAITHVAISLGGSLFIHSNGAAWGVSCNSFDTSSPLYRDWLKKNLAGARRYL